jgi:hypothetical protein
VRNDTATTQLAMGRSTGAVTALTSVGAVTTTPYTVSGEGPATGVAPTMSLSIRASTS